MKILRGGKCWEIRSKSCTKRGRFGVICTSKTSPTGRAQLLGEVTMTGVLKVGQRQNGFVAPPHGFPQNYLFLRRHLQKHQIGAVSDFPDLAKYESIYAWEMANPVEYQEPVPINVKKGCVVWVRLD